MQHLTKADLIEHYTNVRARMAIRQLQGYVNMQAIITPKIEPKKEAKKKPPKIVVPVYNGYPKVAMIKRMIANYYDVTMTELISPRRTSRLVHARQIAYYVIKTHTALSYPQIGRKFGHRDHTTILHGVMKIKKLIETDPDIAGEVERFSKILNEAQQQTVTTEAA